MCSGGELGSVGVRWVAMGGVLVKWVRMEME